MWRWTLVSAGWKSFLFTLWQNLRTFLSSAWTETVCSSLSSQSHKEAAWPQLLIFSRLEDAWWDVEADSWIDWTLLSTQALITTALKCCPNLFFFFQSLFSQAPSSLPPPRSIFPWFLSPIKKRGGWGAERIQRSRITNEDQTLTELEVDQGKRGAAC